MAVRGDVQPAVSGARGRAHHASAVAAAEGLRRGLPGRAGGRRREQRAACGGRGRRRPRLAVVFLAGDYDDAGVLPRLGGGGRPGRRGGRRRPLPAASRASAPTWWSATSTRCRRPTLERLEAAGVELVRHPVRKDRTDGEMAVDEALRRGAGELVLAGALGALDHTLGHLAILRRLAARGVAARLVAPRLTVRVFVAPGRGRSRRAGRHARLHRAAGRRRARSPWRVSTTRSSRGVLPQDACLGLGNAVVYAARASSCTRARWPCSSRTASETFGGARRGVRAAAPDARSPRLATWRPSCGPRRSSSFGVLPTQGVVHAVGRGLRRSARPRRGTSSSTPFWRSCSPSPSTTGGSAAAPSWARPRSPSVWGWRSSWCRRRCPTATARLGDALVDAAGAALGLAVFSAAARARARRPRWRRG